MDGFHVIREKAGSIARRVSLVVDKKVKKEEAIQPVDQQWLCVIVERDSKKAQNEFLGRKNNYNENF